MPQQSKVATDGKHGRRRLQRLLVALGIYGVILGVLYLYMVVWPQEYRVGQTMPYTMFSPITFDYLDRSKESELRGSAGTGEQRWLLDPEAREVAVARYDAFFADLRKLRSQVLLWQKSGELAKRQEEELQSIANRYQLEATAVSILVDLSEKRFVESRDKGRQQLLEMMDGEVTVALVAELRQDFVAATFRSPQQIYVHFLRPNLTLAPVKGPTVNTRALATVNVLKGSVVAAEGQVVDSSVEDMLGTLEGALREQASLRLSGIGVILLLFLCICGLQLHQSEARVFAAPTELLKLGMLFILLLLVALTLGRLPFPNMYYSVVFAIGALSTVTVLVYNSSLAIYLGLGLAALASSALFFGPELQLYTAAGAMLPPLLISKQPQRREQLRLALGLGVQNAALSAMVVVASAHTFHWQIFPISFLAGVGASVAAFGLLPLVEAISGQVTPGKLVELASQENPLLRRLKLEAHGTWAHSINVADLTEEACKAIKADWLLAKVGAIYHDIGKLKRPGFFAENIHDQSRNPHLGLPPETSARIVRDHVADGLALAKESKLPRDLWPFIAEHHGNYLIRYFFAAAQRAHEESPQENPEPEREDFTYLGPLPQSRESAVLMLADISEAVLRTKPEADSVEMRRVIDGIITDKIAEGQLAESGLTLGDLLAIKDAFIRVLAAERHQRILYPAQLATATPLHFHSRGSRN